MQRLHRATKTLAAGLDSDAERFYAAFQELLRAYQFRDRDRACYRDLTITECYALEALEAESPLKVNRLAERLQLDKSGASRVAAALERKGYARRRRDRADQRVVYLEIGAAGRRLHGRIRSELIERQRRLLAGYRAATRAAIIELIQELRRDLERRRCTQNPARGRAGAGPGSAARGHAKR